MTEIARTSAAIRKPTTPPQGWIYAMVRAAEDATCAACMIVAQFRGANLGAFSGTTIESPGFRTAFMGSPSQNPELFLAERTEPSARKTKTAPRSAIWVNPPAWLRYHFALLPGR